MIEWINAIINLVFPKVCPSCNRHLTSKESGICLHCASVLPERLTLDNEEVLQRFYGRLQLEEAFAFLLFKRKGLTQKLLHSIKYKGNKTLALEMGTLFGIRAKQLGLYSSVDVVVPIPLHLSKLRFRGFNQSAFIAQGLASMLAVKLDERAVIRKVKTTTQTKKSRVDRWKNVDQTFEAHPLSLKGKHVLIVDDVITTGATLESCGQTILAAGAEKISIACLALA